MFDFDPRRATRGRLHEWQDRLLISVNASYGDFVERIREENEKAHEGIQTVFENWQKGKRSFKEMYEEERRVYGPYVIKLYCGWFDEYRKIAAGIAPLTLESALPPSSAVLITTIQHIFREEGVGNPNLWPKTIEFHSSDMLQDAPFNRIASSLWAVVACKAAAGQKKGQVEEWLPTSALFPPCSRIVTQC